MSLKRGDSEFKARRENFHHRVINTEVWLLITGSLELSQFLSSVNSPKLANLVDVEQCHELRNLTEKNSTVINTTKNVWHLWSSRRFIMRKEDSLRHDCISSDLARVKKRNF